ncbi:MAG: hypothetical protein A2298_04840, partial [Gammaproteobacteria bacterium RIFOXYB2_FULL_38_6]
VFFPVFAVAQDLGEIQNRGVLRHLGAPYGNFIIAPDKKKNTNYTGFSVDLVRLYAKSIGVAYEFVESHDVHTMIEDLIGTEFSHQQNAPSQITYGEKSTPKGDIIETGLTVLDWRMAIINFSDSTFSTKIWLVGHKDIQSKIPQNFDQFNRAQVLEFANRFQVIGQANTSLDPSLYGIKEYQQFSGSINDYIDLVTDMKENKLAILDFPDAIITLRKAPEKLIVIGEISAPQFMAAAFRKDSPKLLESFNNFLKELKKNGVYDRLVKRYYPELVYY